MAKQRRLVFGSDNVTVSGEPVEVAKKKLLANASAQVKRDLTPDEVDGISSNVVGQRTNEKAILRLLCESYASNKKTIESIKIAIDMIEEIDAASDGINYTDAEVKILNEGITKLKEFPPMWFRYSSLLSQLANFDKCEEVNG